MIKKIKQLIERITENILLLDKNDWNNLAFIFGIVCLIISNFLILFSKYYSNTLAVTGIALLFITMFISYRDER